jgi:hypothetical protein
MSTGTLEQKQEPVGAAPQEWLTNSGGKEYLRRPDGRQGVIHRQGLETVQEALARFKQQQEDLSAGGGKPRPDRKPRTKPPRQPSKPTARELERFLEELLAMPAIPAQMVLGCNYCATHFATEAPKAAKQLVELSAKNPGLRRVLERWYAAWTSISYGAILMAYVGKPMLHHLAPEPMLAGVGPFLGVPPRDNVVSMRAPTSRSPFVNHPHYAAPPEQEHANGAPGSDGPAA